MQKEYNTKVGREITKYIDAQKDMSFSVADVYSYMQDNGMQVNLATIYRNLDRLTEKSILVKFKTANSDTTLYRVAKDNNNCHSHLHMQCKKCAKILHLECNFMNDIVDCLKEQYGFALDCENSSLCGLCEECKKSD